VLIVVLCRCVVGQIDVEGVRLNFWDLGGQEELQSLWDKVMICSALTCTEHTSCIALLTLFW